MGINNFDVFAKLVIMITIYIFNSLCSNMFFYKNNFEFIKSGTSYLEVDCYKSTQWKNKIEFDLNSIFNVHCNMLLMCNKEIICENVLTLSPVYLTL